MRSKARILLAVIVLALPSISFALEDTFIRTYAGGYGHTVLPTPDGGAFLSGSFGATEGRQ